MGLICSARWFHGKTQKTAKLAILPVKRAIVSLENTQKKLFGQKSIEI